MSALKIRSIRSLRRDEFSYPRDLCYGFSLGFRELEDLVKRITYKPNVTVRLIRAGGEMVFLHIEQMVPDAEGRTTGLIKVILQEPVPRDLDTEEHAMLFIRHCIKRSEEHEIDEWLRLDGKRVREPHP